MREQVLVGRCRNGQRGLPKTQDRAIERALMHGDERCIRDRELIIHASNNINDVRVLCLPTATRNGCYLARTDRRDEIRRIQCCIGALAVHIMNRSNEKSGTKCSEQESILVHAVHVFVDDQLRNDIGGILDLTIDDVHRLYRRCTSYIPGFHFPSKSIKLQLGPGQQSFSCQKSVPMQCGCAAMCASMAMR